MGKMKRSNHNIYALDRWEPVEDMTIVFDDECISKYVDEMCPVYGVTQSTLWEIIKNEKIENSDLELKPKIKLPPWFSLAAQGVGKGVEVVSGGVGNMHLEMSVGVGK